MNGHARSVVATHAWRSALDEHESRAYLQSRLITLSKLMFWSFVAFLTYVTVLYETGLLIPEPRENLTIFAAATVGLVLLVMLWRWMKVRPVLPLRVLYAIDTFYAFGTGALLAFGAYMATELPPAPYSCLLFTCLIVLTRAIMIPSSGRRTIAISVVAFVPFLFAGIALALSETREFEDMKPPATISSVLLVFGVVTSLAAKGSQTLYGLRQQANAAMQLGQYTLDTKIGEGGMGVVYRAHHVLLRRPTAVKLLHPERVGADTVDRFEREVQHMSQLTHPNTVAIYDFGRSHDGTFYYAMEYLDGIDLADLVATFGQQPIDRVIDILVQVCGAMHEAHTQGIIHRDIKPANILLCERGAMTDVAKVVDFGLVKKISGAPTSADDASKLQRGLTVDSQMILGTPGYLAPEAVMNPQSIGPSSDLYSLGAVAYFLLTGQRVFDGATPMAVCLRHVSDSPEPIAGVRPLPAELDALVMRCLAKTPAERPASARELADALRGIPRTGDWSESLAATWWTAFRHRASAPVSSTDAPLTMEVDLGARMSSARSIGS